MVKKELIEKIILLQRVKADAEKAMGPNFTQSLPVNSTQQNECANSLKRWDEACNEICKLAESVRRLPELNNPEDIKWREKVAAALERWVTKHSELKDALRNVTSFQHQNLVNSQIHEARRNIDNLKLILELI